MTIDLHVSGGFLLSRWQATLFRTRRRSIRRPETTLRFAVLAVAFLGGPVQSEVYHLSYVGECVPIASDVDCARGSGDGPEYIVGPVPFVGPDDYGLDRDRNGIGCE